jgi:hypothetical protein
MRLKELNYDIGNFSIHRGQLDKHQRWYHGKPKKAKPYKLPSGPFRGKAENYTEHILGK